MPRIHVTGASGSGTTTLGRMVAAELDACWLDSDDAFWRPSEPPYTEARPPEERLSWLLDRLPDDDWVVSGSLMRWGDPLLPKLDLVVFLLLDQTVRMARLRAREADRYGARIAPGGDMAEQSADFLAWAAAYDTAGTEQRSRTMHEQWLAALPCPVLRLDSAQPVERLAARVLEHLAPPAGHMPSARR